MSAADHLSPKQFTLYRGEGSHDQPSPYYGKNSTDPGGWWTTDPKSAGRYAAGMPGGKVYTVDVEPHEAPARGARGYHFISDPAVRARRTLHKG